jgi:hypothetical protein
VAALVVTAGLLVCGLGSRASWLRDPYLLFRSIPLDAGGRSVRAVDCGARGGTITLQFTDSKSGKTIRRTFGSAVQPFEIDGRSRVYILQQRPGEASCRVLIWDAGSNMVRRLLAIPSARDSLLRDCLCRLPVSGSVRPDGRCMIVSVCSVSGQCCSVWLVDIAAKRGTIALACDSPYCDDARWVEDKAILLGWDGAVALDPAKPRTGWVDLSGANKTRSAKPIKADYLTAK